MRKLYTFLVAMFVCIATSAADYTFSASCSPSFMDYVVDETYFPAAEIASKLGLENTDALKALIETNTAFYLLQGDETRTNENFSDANQPWMTAEPRVNGYGAEGTCWFAGIGFAEPDGERVDPSVNAWVGVMPNFFKTVYEPTDLKATFFLVNGEKEVSFEFNLHVDAAEYVGPVLLSTLNVVDEYAGTLNFTQGGQYEGKKLEIDVIALAGAFGVDLADFEEGFANHVMTQKVFHNPESGEDEITDTLDLPENLAGGSWFGRYADVKSGNPDAMLLQNAPKAWGAGCTFYLQAPTLADGKFTLTYGQYPGTLVPNDKDFAVLYIVYGDKAAKVTVTVNVEVPDDVPFSEMQQASQVDITLSQAPTNDYATVSFSIDVAAAAELLGAEAASDVTLFPLKDEESLHTGGSTANNGGWWFNKSGFVCNWASGSDGSYFFIEPAVTGDYSAMNMGQMPNQYQVGDQAVTDLYLVYGAKYVKYHVVLNITEKPIIDDNEWTVVANRTIVVKQTPNDGYVWSEQAGFIKAQDLTNLLETTAPILFAEEMDSLGAVAKTQNYTMGEKPGFWMTSEGYATGWGNESTWGMTSQLAATGATGGDWGFKCMQFPGSGTLGSTFQGTFYLLNPENNKCIKVILINQVVENVAEQEVVGEQDVVLPVSVTGQSIEFPLDSIAEALGVDVDELYNGGNYMHGLTGPAVKASDPLQFDEQGNIAEGVDYAFLLLWDDASTIYIESNMEAEVSDEWSVMADVYFEVEAKQYILHCRFVSLNAYQEYITGINTVKAGKQSSAIFDLSGRQVQKAQKGIFIQNGKKVVK